MSYIYGVIVIMSSIHMQIDLEIKPCVGLSGLLFGESMKDAEKLFGKAEEVALFDDVDDAKSTVWHYWENGFSLFFDEMNSQIFCCAEIDNPEVTIWGKRVFDLNEKELIHLFKENNYKLFETEVHEWGEKRLSFDDANIDFYFEKNKLTSINFGKPYMSSQILILPN